MNSLIEVVDETNTPTGKLVSADEVNRRGYWHRGVHGIVLTTAGQVVVQKRSAKIVFHPNMLDISFGGGVDAGESPDKAVIRELKEELGLTVDDTWVHFVGISKYNHYWPTYKKHPRNFVYSYIIVLPNDHTEFTLQEEEVAGVRFISMKEARRLIKSGRLKSFGQLEPIYKYYKFMLDAAEQQING